MNKSITVSQFLRLYRLSNNTASDISRTYKALSIYSGKSIAELEDIPLFEINKLGHEFTNAMTALEANAKPVSFLKANGRLYQVNYKPATITPKAAIELQQLFQKGDWVTNTDKIIAALVVPVKKYLWVKLPARKAVDPDIILRDVGEFDFSEVLGCIQFFSKIFTASIEGIKEHLITSLINSGISKGQSQETVTKLIHTLKNIDAINNSHTNKTSIL